MGITDNIFRDNDNIRYDCWSTFILLAKQKRSVTVYISTASFIIFCPENEQDPNGEHAPLFEYRIRP